jgi:hypothetical protein
MATKPEAHIRELQNLLIPVTLAYSSCSKVKASVHPPPSLYLGKYILELNHIGVVDALHALDLADNVVRKTSPRGISDVDALQGHNLTGFYRSGEDNLVNVRTCTCKWTCEYAKSIRVLCED